MAFYEVRFPESVSLGASGGPGFSTRVVSTASGFEYRNENWARDRGKWNVAHGLKTPDDWATLLAFFRIMRGRKHGFRFKDWTDHTCSGGEGQILTNPKGQLQLAKVYAVPGAPVSVPAAVRFIAKPVDGTLALPVGVTVDVTTGLVTAGGSSGQIWTGEFDVPCRFDIDEMDLALPQAYAASWPNIPIVELRQ